MRFAVPKNKLCIGVDDGRTNSHYGVAHMPPRPSSALKSTSIRHRLSTGSIAALERLSSRHQIHSSQYWGYLEKREIDERIFNERVATYQTEVGVSKCLALAIEKRAKELELAFPKRAHDAVEAYSDDENSDAGSMSSGEYRSRRPKKQQGNKKKGVKPVTRTIALTDSDANGRYEMKNPVFN
ncbi:hypothetical protein BDB00DRAFT_870547 [Zychaea mexicana]|uniref:uncharacterized protein n=1 Tax=Zychaea mexicana TaxID=64656 RepID=UPI0022FE750C|nr:uncharacterized protein BDB00DRAFT_870547 [Zychaea mexicana]KAI9495396.1 hypothetical protein BDB00DRAFT_870547 [Zychaea mexicana]